MTLAGTPSPHGSGARLTTMAPLSRALHTTVLPRSHGPVEYQWQNTGLCPRILRHNKHISDFVSQPVENRTCHCDGLRLRTFDCSPWGPMKRRGPLRQFHRDPPVDSLRVHWVPLWPSVQRRGAFAVRPRPGGPSFPGCTLRGPLRLFLGPRGCVGGSRASAPLPFASHRQSPVVLMKDANSMLEVACG